MKSNVMRRVRFAIAASTALAGGVVSEAALAQSSGTSQDGLEEIVVTAQRRSESLQQVPISVTAVDENAARRLNIVETKNLQFTTPGLSFPEDNGTINPYIRGRGTNFSGPGLEGSIAIYIDESYLQTQFGSSGLIDISQIQVLKGPQGTLYGRNATGGAILINTNNPTHRLEGYVEAGYGQYATRKIEGVLNLPITNNLAIRFAGGYNARNGFVRNVVDGEMNGQMERYQFRTKLLWEPTDRLRVILRGEYQKMSNDYLRNQIYDGTGKATNLGFYETIRSPRVPDSQSGENRVRVWSVGSNIQYTAGAFNIVNVTNYRDTQIRSCSDNDNIYEHNFDFCPSLPGTAEGAGVYQIPNRLDPNAPATLPAAYDRTFSTDTRVTSDFDGPFSLLVGASYQHSKARFAAALTGTAFGPLLPVFDNHMKIDNWAIYAEGSYKLANRVKITLGGRFSKDIKAIQVYNNADVGLALGIPAAFLPASFNQRDSWKSFTPRAVLAYDAGIGNFYVSYSAGFKSGGFNAPTPLPQVALSPEKIDGFEAGAKLRLLENIMSLDLAVFHTKSKDIQVAAIDTSIGAVVQQNAATAKADGAEANFRLAPAHGLNMQLGVAYLHSRFTSFPNASVFTVAPNPLFGGANTFVGAVENLSGRETPLSPKWKINGSATYEFDLISDWKASVTLSGAFSSAFDFQAGAGGPQRYARQNAYTVINLTGDFLAPSENLRLSWYVTNLFKEHYYDIFQTNAQSGSIIQGGGVYGGPGLPRVIGGSVRVSF